MLDKQELLNLLNKQEYAKIIEYFSDEYNRILREFLRINKLSFKENSNMEELFMLVEENFPRFSGLIQIIRSSLIDEDLSTYDSLDNLISNYNYIKEKLT